MDEVGTALGICTNTIVLAESSKKRTYVMAPQDREWVLAIEAVSATGCKTRPLVIFKGKEPQSSWFEEDAPDWVYTTSENGWTLNRIAIGWLQNVFLPETQQGNQARILILDGHGSHISIEFLWLCKQENVQLVFLPPHSSYILQPLDLSCFSPLKSRYRSQIAALAVLDDSAPVKKQRFI
ncbi:CENP-B protein [Lepidopterella palustris CBS 459.81]|uniref:CENP-B protein n=1 Tax=Lepidopterella palustris CBS 459.81 TaxID=1314670 RepID=A0A8E2E1Y1_9PEZI|nr:CENP-B protein [Lepidopterella palustris CBS 459.81]